MIAIVALIFPFFALVALGFLAGRWAKKPVDGLAWLNVFIVYIALPALFFQLLSKTPVEKLASPGFVAATTLATLSVFLIVFWVAYRRIRRGPGDRAAIAPATIQGLAGAYGNIGYMGPGIALAAFGPEAAVPVALVFCFDNTLHFTLAPLCMAMAGESDRRPSQIVAGVLAKIFGHPFILATIVGIGAAILGVSLPQPLSRLAELLANAAAPCALFAMGVTLALRPLKRVPPELGFIVPAKLLLHPALAFLALSAIGGVDPVWLHAAVLMAALPTATNVFVIAQQYSVWTERASAAVLTTTVFSAVTVSCILYAMSTGNGPLTAAPRPPEASVQPVR